MPHSVPIAPVPIAPAPIVPVPTDAASTEVTVPTSVLEFLDRHAPAMDRGERSGREVLPLLAGAGLLDLGTPFNAEGKLPAMVSVLETVARHSLSAAFTAWGHRVTLEFLAAAGTGYARERASEMSAGHCPGVSAMAAGFRELVGLGRVGLTAFRVDGGYRLSGTLPWASNLYDDSVVVTCARTEADRLLVLAFPTAAEGVSMGEEPRLLALQGTASAAVVLDDVQVPDAQVLSTDFTGFLRSVRPGFSILQTALAAGLARECLQRARTGATGVNEVYAQEIKDLGERTELLRADLRSLAASMGTPGQRPPRDCLSLRLEAGRLANELAALELKTAGGCGFTLGSEANRRFREATFIALQSPSEAQLLAELR